ncbi:MAG: hypothetical protein HZB76_02775 [Chlamydiae bacterium]|nr:hypothetical protein [Chlamydiota bacterium]
MSVSDKPSFISTLSIASPDDIERVLDRNEKLKQKISTMLEGRNIRIEENINDLRQLSSLSKLAYCGSQGFSSCSEVEGLMDRSQSQLQKAFTVLNDRVAPLVMGSFKCHQAALKHIENGCKALVVQEMAQVDESAKEITAGYKKLASEFKLLGDEAGRVLSLVIADQTPLYAKQREINERQKKGESTPTDSSENTVLQTKINSLDSSITSLGKITTVLKNTGGFWSSVGMLSDSTSVSDSRIIGAYTGAQMPAEAVKALEDSYLVWLSVAKINQTITGSLLPR